MKKFLSVLLTLIISFGQTNVFANETSNDVNNIVEETGGKDTSFIVKYKAANMNIARSSSNDEITLSESSNMEVINFNEEKSIEEVEKELNDSNIEYIQPNYVLELAAVEYGADYSAVLEEDSNQEASDIVEIKNNDENLSKKVVIGILDSEIDENNIEIKDFIGNEKFSTIDNSRLSKEERGFEQVHATHLAGIIAGKSSVLNGYMPNISIMPLSVFKSNQARTSDIIEAINYAKINGVDIINMSFGCSENNNALKETIENSPEITFVAAAGNYKRNIDEKPVYPAAFDLPNIISVTSINNDGGLSYYADYGENNVDIAALGKEIESTVPDNERRTLSGTSMSAAVVTRGLSILYSENKCSSPEEYKTLLIASADKVSSLTNYVGNSAKLNIDNALNGITNNEIETINYEDEFSISTEVYDANTAYSLFAISKTISISAGEKHVIALKEDGSVWAWGDNSYGQLGNGTYISSTHPVRVVGLTGITSIEAGGYHNIAKRADGTIYMWGRGDSGQLGLGTINRSTPAQFTYTTVNSFAAGDKYTVISHLNMLYGFGDNYNGQIGDVSEGTQFTSPHLVDRGDYSETDIYSLGAGYNSTMYITDRSDNDTVTNNNAKIWGMGSIFSNAGPIKRDESNIGFKRNFAIGSNHAIVYADEIYNSFGDNTYGQRATTDNINDYEEFAAGRNFTLGKKSDGTVYTWGIKFYQENYYDEENEEYAWTAVHTKLSLSNITDITAGGDFALFLDSSGNIWGLGNNAYGQLGNGTTTNVYSTPVKVNEISINEDESAIKVAAGYNHSLALKADGTVWAWGNNTYGQLGNGNTTNLSEPAKVSGLTNVKDIEAGNGFSLALKTDGTLWAWGKNNYGQLGNGTNTNSSVPVRVQIDKTVKTMSAGYEHSLLVTEDKYAYAWGRNNYYQLCDKTTYDSNIPICINLTYLSDVSAGYRHSVLLKEDGTVYTCGDNTYSKLGGNRDSDYYKPVSVMTNAIDIAAGTNNTMILSSNGTVYMCGYNLYGNLGIGNTVMDFTAITGPNAITEIEGGDYCYAKSSDGKNYIWGWGNLEAPFYGYTVCEENSNINILDISDITDVSINGDNILLIKNNKVYARKNTYAKLENGFFVPLAWNYKAYMPPSNGSGTSDDPYLIYSIEDFYKIKNDISAYYKLMSDIDLNGDQIHPIISFKGHFDGNNKTISNFKIKVYDNVNYDYVGLFCELTDATVERLNIDGADIVGYGNTGIIAGILYDDYVKNCNIIDTSVSSLNGGNCGIIGAGNLENVINCTYSPRDLASVTFAKTINVTNGQEYRFFLTSNNINDVSTIRYFIEYDADVLNPIKIGENPTQQGEKQIYKDNTITNISNEDGILSFEITSDNKNWSGVLCPIVFKAKTTDTTTIEVSVGNVA